MKNIHLQNVYNLIKKHKVEFIDLKAIDLVGRLHHVTLPYYDNVLEKSMNEGVGFDGSSYGFRKGENSDMILMPDLETAKIVSGIAIILLFTACLVAAVPLSAAPAAQDAPPSPLSGKDLYAQNCAPCHGATGNGDGPSVSGLSVPPSAFADPNAVAGKSLAELFDITKNGNMQRMMPPWKNRLNDSQIWDAVAYAWTLHTTPAQVDMGKAVYEANCAACHGTDGKGTATGPSLSDFAATSEVSQAMWAQVVAGGKGKDCFS